MKLYNTLSRTIEEFKPLNPPQVTMYACGPTVYDYSHIGHAWKYIYDDVLKRTLTYLGYNVKHVMNITDVGHLTSDADAGEDKLEKGAKQSGKTVWEVAQFYTDFHLKMMQDLNIITPTIIAKATDHIQDMINLIKKLEEKGVTYQTDEAVYFDIMKFPDYGKLSRQKLDEKIQGARDEVVVDPKKKHPADFALWFKRVGRFANHEMHWPSPWGEGFPGWHIECSAMSMKYLGETIDIHTGGPEHIAVHHEDEIAQSECATGKQFVRYWVHYAWVQIKDEKMSKSLGNFYTVEDIKKNGLDPLTLRFLYLQAHYRQGINFSWESLRSAQEAYKKLKDMVISLRKQTQRSILSEEKMEKVDDYRQRFVDAISNDLQTPQAIAIMWEMLKSNIPSPDKLDLLFEFDQILGLNLKGVEEEQIPEEITKLAEQRQQLKQEKDFQKADELRKTLTEKGFEIMDTIDGYSLKKK